MTDPVTRDVQQISDIERPAEMRRLLSVAAARMGTLAVVQSMANRLGNRFQTGIVLYAGEQQLSFGDRLSALPMAALWMLDSSAR